MKIRKNVRWANTIGRYESKPVTYFKPESLQDIISMVKDAEEKNLKVRAIGSGHSFSDVAIPDDYLADISLLQMVQKADRAVLKSQFAGIHLVNAEAGVTVRELNRQLDKLGLALLNMGGIDHQTLAGVIATATHGTGKDLPSFPGFVKSITLVAGSGKVYRIEPGGGITDPEKFNYPGINLVQDDDTFYSVLVSLGSSGIIYSCILEVWPTYYLRETKKLTNWTELKKKFLDGSIFTEGDEESNGKPPRGVSFLINPYEVKGDRHTCIVMRHYYTTQPQKWILIEATRNIISGILGNIPTVFYITHWLFRWFPRRSPFLIRRSLRGMKDDKFVHRSHKVLYQGFEFVKERAYDAEFAFHLADVPNVINTIDGLIAKAAEFRDTKNIFQSSPLGVRFVQRSKAYLTPEYERDVAYLDTPFLLGIDGTEELLDAYQQVMFNKGGIPHWGKTNTILNNHPDFIEKNYSKLNTWKQVIRQLDPKGTFKNAFTERLKLPG